MGTHHFPLGLHQEAQTQFVVCFFPPYGVGADGLSHCSVLAKESAEVAEELIQLKVVHGLMVALGNLDHMASQRHASISLEVSRVVQGSGHHSTGSAPCAPERKGSLHWGFFFSPNEAG